MHAHFYFFFFFNNLATPYDQVTCRVAHGKPPVSNTVLTTAEDSMLLLDMARWLWPIILGASLGWKMILD